jgi:hypothetical protein
VGARGPAPCPGPFEVKRTIERPVTADRTISAPVLFTVS